MKCRSPKIQTIARTHIRGRNSFPRFIKPIPGFPGHSNRKKGYLFFFHSIFAGSAVRFSILASGKATTHVLFLEYWRRSVLEKNHLLIWPRARAFIWETATSKTSQFSSLLFLGNSYALLGTFVGGGEVVTKKSLLCIHYEITQRNSQDVGKDFYFFGADLAGIIVKVP